MTTTQHTTTQPQLIAVSRLEKSPHNARRTGAKAAIEELKASILAHGLMQNLVVTDAGDGAYRSDGITLECLMAFTVTDDHRRQLKVFKSLQDWQEDDPGAIRVALTEKMVEASSKLARFVGLDAYVAAGGSTRADLFGDEVYLEKPALVHRLAEEKLAGIRKELEAEGWGWIEINPERDWNSINRCGRIQPRLIDA